MPKVLITRDGRTAPNPPLEERVQLPNPPMSQSQDRLLALLDLAGEMLEAAESDVEQVQQQAQQMVAQAQDVQQEITEVKKQVEEVKEQVEEKTEGNNSDESSGSVTQVASNAQPPTPPETRPPSKNARPLIARILFG